MAARRAVDARSANRQFDAIVASRLGKHARLIGKDILVASHPTLLYLLHVHQVRCAWYLAQALLGCVQFVLLPAFDQHLIQFQRRSLQRRIYCNEQPEHTKGRGGE
ncbi:hypothetical protein D3C77_557870 [compost metagenome]